MDSSTDLPGDRLAVGQLLVRLLHRFRADMLVASAGTEFDDTRLAHLQIWGNVGVDGVRLTTLADRANLSLAAASELVSELEMLGYLERRPDPTDGRAKLIHPTERGRALLAAAGRQVATIESGWAAMVGSGEFDAACRTLNSVLAGLGDHEAQMREGGRRNGLPAC